MNRLLYLDSLRGIAALFVIIFHLIDPFFLNYNFNLEETPISNLKIFSRALFNGSDWVSLFFVLSGFSLSFSLEKEQNAIDLKSFYFKRILRIYPLYLFVLLLTFIFLNNDDSIFSFLRQTLLFNFQNNLVPPSWSLSIEIIASFLLPFLYIIYINNKNAFYYLILISLLLYNGIGQSQASSMGFVFHFLLGILLMDLYKRKTTLNRKYFIILIPFIFMSFTSRWMIDFFPKEKYFIQLLTDFLNMDFHQFFYFFSAIGAFSLIYIILSSASIQKFLSIKILTFLGKISFSIYMIHFFIIHSFFERIVRCFEPINNIYLEPLCSISTLLILVVLVSTILFYTIEKPFLELSRYILKLRHKMP